ncbi:MAG: sugar O-acyltransferase [Flexilinea sp.]
MGEKKDLILVGAGGYAREIVMTIDDINKIRPTWNILGFLSDTKYHLDGKRCKYSIIGGIQDWEVKTGQFFVMAIADPKGKETLAKLMLNKQAEFVSIIHPWARLSESAQYGIGLIMDHPTIALGPDVVVGDFVSLNGSGLGHDVEVGDFSTISSNCGINGGVKIGKRVFIGGNVVIAPQKKIGDDAFVGTGSVVINNVKPGIKVFGNPAKKIDF